ncbi:MAG: hypothetical protein AB7V14_09895 [Kiritimatiellia bacterium]
MDELPVQRGHFRVDTRRPRSRTKMRSKIRQILAVSSGMFPLMAAFVVAMSWFRLPVQRMPYYKLAIVFFACGMATLLLYAWARAEKLRRREVSNRNRELRHREREEAWRREEAEMRERDPAASAKGG